MRDFFKSFFSCDEKFSTVNKVTDTPNILNIFVLLQSYEMEDLFSDDNGHELLSLLKSLGEEINKVCETEKLLTENSE
jgi:hypothetical protein